MVEKELYIGRGLRCACTIDVYLHFEPLSSVTKCDMYAWCVFFNSTARITKKKWELVPLFDALVPVTIIG